MCNIGKGNTFYRKRQIMKQESGVELISELIITDDDHYMTGHKPVAGCFAYLSLQA